MSGLKKHFQQIERFSKTSLNTLLSFAELLFGKNAKRLLWRKEHFSYNGLLCNILLERNITKKEVEKF